jgi:hypothetical protein
MWRGHIYNIVINAFKNVADVAPQLHQLGYRDKVTFAAGDMLMPIQVNNLQSALIAENCVFGIATSTFDQKCNFCLTDALPRDAS